MTSLTTSTRRGAPAGNTNALKHGFYARKFRPAEAKDLDGYTFDGVKEEILVLRVIIRRTLELAQSTEDRAEVIALLRVVSLAVIALTRLVRTELLLNPAERGLYEKALQQALAEVTAEWGMTAS